MTDVEVDAIIDQAWQAEASLTANLRALVRAAACYGWRCAQAARWIEKHSTNQPWSTPLRSKNGRTA